VCFEILVKNSRCNTRYRNLASLLLIMFLLTCFQSLSFGSDVYVHAAQGPINFVSAIWVGGGAIPGDNDALLNITIQNLNSVPIFGIQEELNLSSGELLNTTNGFVVNSVVQGSVQPGDLGAAIFSFNIPASANVSVPTQVPLIISYENGTATTVQVISIPITVDQPMPLSIVATGWSGSSNGTVLALGSGGAQGDLEDFLIIQLNNPNPFSINSLTGTISYNINDMYNSTGGNTSVYSGSTPAVVPPNSDATLSFPVNISPNATIGTVPIIVSLSYQDPWFRALTQDAMTTAQIYGAATVSINQVSSVIRAGQTSPISFVVTNIGTSPMYTPQLTLTLRSGMVVTGNTTSPARNPTINPGASTTFAFDITTASNFPVGTYHATAIVYYDNEFGIRERAGFSTSILVAGTIILSFQSVNVVQNYNNVSVIANVINYGTSGANLTKANAYLSTVPNGSSSSRVLLASTSAYVGTISPLAPSFFTIILPYTSKNVPMSANLTIVLSYENGTGVSLQSSNTTIVSLLPSSQLPQPPGLSQTEIIGGAVVAVIIIVLIVSYLFLKRGKKAETTKTARNTATAPDST
jgi:hypothetical protein